MKYGVILNNEKLFEITKTNQNILIGDHIMDDKDPENPKWYAVLARIYHVRNDVTALIVAEFSSDSNYIPSPVPSHLKGLLKR